MITSLEILDRTAVLDALVRAGEADASMRRKCRSP
jgi:hypothetical protein